MLALFLHIAMAQAVDATFVTTPVVLDGKLDEAAWAQAEPITDFVKFAPTVGGEPPGQTEVRFVHDDHNLYIGVHVDNRRPVRYRWAPREDINQDDQIGIFLDTFGEEYAGYVFYFNALGIQQDLRVNSGRWNFFWDAVLESKGQVDGDSWELEVAIPFRSLKYPAGSGPQEWGLLVQRIDVADVSQYSFPEFERGQAALWERAAPLRIEPPPRGSGLEIMPSVTAVQQSHREETGQMEWTGFDKPLQAFRPSLDLRFGITPNIGFTGTVNPDFSQVENDETPIELNQRFAFWFEERRPFFLDGFDLFQDRHEVLYTRSIVEPVAGIKVGGKEGPVSVGFLHATDRSPGPSVHEHSAPGFGSKDVEDAFAANTVARLAADAFGSGYVGVTFADKRILPREGDSAGVNDVVGLDLFAPLPKRWVAAGGGITSLTGDGQSTPLLGYGVEGYIGRQSGIGTGGYAQLVYTHPDLRMETGFATQTGFVEAEGRLDHTFEPGFVDTLMPMVMAHYRTEYDGDGYWSAQLQVETQAGANNVGLWYGRQRFREDDVHVDGGYFGGWYWGRPTGWLELNPSAYSGRVLDYARLAPAQSTGTDVRVTLWPTRHMRLDTSVGLRWFAPEEDDLERSTRVRSRLGYQFTPAWGARLIAEYSGGSQFDDRFTGSLLLTWLLHPGTGVWLGYAESGTLEDHYRTTERTVFAKVSVLVRP